MNLAFRSSIRAIAFFAITVAIVSANATEYQKKFDVALDALGIAPEETPDYSAFPSAADKISAKEFLSIIDYIDPDSTLRKYMKITGQKVEFYSDRIDGAMGPNPVEYSLDLAPEGSQDSQGLMSRLEKIANSVKTDTPKPLDGLRVLIDPGHIGGEFWDLASGKYMSVGGAWVSEANLTLWTALLLTNTLRDLGAEVFLTRESAVPVATSFETYQPTNEIAQAIYANSRADWMQAILKKPEPQMREAIQKAPEVIKIQDTSRETHYLKADLFARSDRIDEIKPDLFIDIHFDAQDVNVLRDVNNATVYVPGFAEANEYGSRNARARMLKHALEVRRWKQSVKIAKTVVDRLSKNMNIPLGPKIAHSVTVEEGVLARNVVPTHRSVHGLTMYFECAHYDDRDEFKRMSTMDAEGNYQGRLFRYPSRLDTIANGMRDGILEYFKNFSL